MNFIEKQPIHLLIRFSDNLFGVGNVISKHTEVIENQGFVWFGKLGTAIGENHIETINIQCEQGIPSYLYLVKGNRRKLTFYKAQIVDLSMEYPKKEIIMIPPYYFEKGIVKYIKFWAKLSGFMPLAPGELEGIKVRSSVLDIQETLVRSSSGHFIIQEVK